MKKKILIVLLAMAVLITFMPMTAYANTKVIDEETMAEVESTSADFGRPLMEKPSAGINSGENAKKGEGGEIVYTGIGVRYEYDESQRQLVLLRILGWSRIRVGQA